MSVAMGTPMNAASPSSAKTGKVFWPSAASAGERLRLLGHRRRSSAVSRSPPRSSTTMTGVNSAVPSRSWRSAARADSESVGRLAVELSLASGSMPAPSSAPEKSTAITTTTQLSRRPDQVRAAIVPRLK